MADFCESGDTSDIIVDVHIMENEETEENGYLCNVPTQNRYSEERSGRGSEWSQVRRSKRKKVSSSGSVDIIDKHKLSELSDDDRFLCLHDLLTKNSGVLEVVRKEQSRYFQAVEDLQTSVVNLTIRADQTDRVVSGQNEHLKMLTYRSIDLEARSRRNNLIFYGITERSHPDMIRLVLGFLEDELEIDTDGMAIERAHRLGPRVSYNRRMDDPKRPIIVRFRDYTDTELIMRRVYKLKGTPFGIDRDYPKEIANARRQLYASQEAREARQHRRKVQIVYPAKLIIEGQLKEDKFPEWQKYMGKDRLQELQFITSANSDTNSVKIQYENKECQNVSKSGSDGEISSGDDGESDSESVFSVANTQADDNSCNDKRESVGQSIQTKSRDHIATTKDKNVNKHDLSTKPRRQSLRGRRNKRMNSTKNFKEHYEQSAERVRPPRIDTNIQSSGQGQSKNRTVVSQNTNKNPLGNNAHSTKL